jgi:protein-S-isoprenylcysteine O-methyltransferase Ste14
MDIIGKNTINPLVFYTGKISGYFTWIVMVLSFFKLNIFEKRLFRIDSFVYSFILTISLVFIVFSLINLGKSTRLGLPKESTSLKTDGLYKISRNPMYVGFNLLTISAVLSCFNWIMLLLGIYSIIVYHFIILGEEAFLEKRFGQKYLDYKLFIRRYL